MPLFRYTGPPGMYPQGRDTLDRPIGAVNTGDVRDLDEAPDTAWVPLDPGLQEHIEALQQITEDADGSEPTAEPAADGSSETPPDPEPEPTADTSEQDDNEAGQPGSEEQ